MYQASVVRINANSFPMTSQERGIFARVSAKVIEHERIDSEAVELSFSSCDALVVVSAKVSEKVIAQLRRCRIVARYGSGTDNMDVAAATRNGIVVTNVPDFCLSEVAEHTLALLLGVARKLVIMDHHTRKGEWSARVYEDVRRIAGKTLGLVGFGGIAREVARRARAFDLQVLAYDPIFDRGAAALLGVEPTSLDELLGRSDFVSLHVPLTPETHHMISEAQLRIMKPTSILINTARGSVVDECALVRALSERWIAGAGLDVYEGLAMFDSPSGAVDHPLFHLENVVLTPHSAGCSQESLTELMREGAIQVSAVLRGEWPSHCVNRAVIPRVPLTIEPTTIATLNPDQRFVE